MRLSLLFPVILLVLAVPVYGGVHFTEVYPDTWMKGDEDEYLTIAWDQYPGLLSITDGEGTMTLALSETGPGCCTIARSGEAFRKVWGRYPDLELIDSASAVPDAVVQGRFQLSNRKDELTLVQNGAVADSVSWPGLLKNRKGQIHFRSAEGIWDERPLMAGGSRLESETFSNVSGVAGVSPDCSRDILEDAIRNAGREILLNVYEFTDPGLADLLCEAQGRGVQVSVLMEGGPVGGIPPEEFPVIHSLMQAGIPVRLMEGTDEDHPPYRFDHAKYLVIDASRVFLTTENFKGHSFPASGFEGNRGWSVLLSSPELAVSFLEVFKDDYNGPGVSEAQGREGAYEEPPQNRYTPLFAQFPFTGAVVIPVFSPDTSRIIADLINQSRSRVWIQQAYITEYEGGQKNPFLAAAVDAARRGVDVRILLDGYYYNIEDDDDNDEMADRLMTLAACENISLQAKVLYPEKVGLLKVHTKGLICDDQVLISSMNWNENSACFNREAGVIIKSKEVASYYASVFLKDWSGKGDRRVPGAATGQDNSGLLQMAALAGVMIFLILLYRRYHR